MALSFPHPTTSSSRATTSHNRRRLNNDDHHQPLLPGLPDDIAQLCLSRVPPSTLYSVCRSWRRVIYTSDFPAFLSLYTISSDQNSALQVSCFDPISSEWKAVTQPPHLNNVRLRHHSFISRNFSVQSLSVAGNLVLLAGTSGYLEPALSNPLIFNPLSETWSSGPPFLNPRRWCSAGVSRAAVVVASGIGSRYNLTVARSVDKWVLPETNLHNKKCKISNGVWKKMQSLKDSKFSREAIDSVGCKGKLFMVNGKGTCVKQGAVYDVDSDQWSEMPAEMLSGWKGPAAALDEEVIYMVDECKGILKKYDDLMKLWVDVLEDKMLKGADHIVAGGGRVCVVRDGGVGILVVDVTSSSPPRLSVLDTPVGEQVLRLHILPRMCSPEFE
ncbi:F-box/kelch-repeat protein SKIP25-like [Rutidosis leptorrhynchoides]|uniref:F-box/kelch-repeat protein SKIP25-like n=1 Tax=Rutidosis leptorrhynchoides TaxID=125765 RepID=UPI003A98E9F6